MKNKYPDIQFVKSQLRGAQFKRLLFKKGTNKYRVARDCGISYRTLINWQNGSKPSDESALRVGKYLGLIDMDEEEKYQLKKQLKEIEKKIERLS